MLREAITAILSLSIAAISLWILWDTYGAAKITNVDEKAFGRQKDLLLLGLGLLGTVTGYYLGRVPAERQADASRRQADAAADNAKRAEQSEARTKQQVRTGLDIIEREHREAFSPPMGGEAMAGARGASSDRVMNAVNQLRSAL